MRKILISTLLIAACGINLFAQSQVRKAEYDVFAAVLTDIRRNDLKEFKKAYSFVILDETYFDPGALDEGHAKKFKGLLRDFKLKNRNPSKLKRLFPITYGYEITNRSEIDRLLEIGSREFNRVKAENAARNVGVGFGSEIVWKPFFEWYPNASGYYRFSRAGFSESGKYSLVVVEGEGGSWTSSTWYILRKAKGKWAIQISAGGHWVE